MNYNQDKWAKQPTNRQGIHLKELERALTDPLSCLFSSLSFSIIGNTLYRGIARDLAMLSDDEEYGVEEHVSPMHNRFQYKRVNNDLQLQAAK